MILAFNLFIEKEVAVSKKDDDQDIFKGFRYNNLYLVDFTSKDANLKTCYSPKQHLGGYGIEDLLMLE